VRFSYAPSCFEHAPSTEDRRWTVRRQAAGKSREAAANRREGDLGETLAVKASRDGKVRKFRRAKGMLLPIEEKKARTEKNSEL
jgi:hypothetical protein